MWFVYVLRSLTDGTLYIGSAESLDEALRKHAMGKVAATAKKGEMSCEVYIGVGTKKQAANLEKFLKSKPGTAMIRKEILLER